METQYKIKIGGDERGIPSTLLSYEKTEAEVVSDKATTNQDFAVVEACRGLAGLVNSQQIEIIIK